MKRAFFLMGLLCLAVIAPPVRAQQAQQSEREAMYRRYLEFASYVKGGKIEPHWMADGASFWYAEGAPANTVIYKVDPKASTKKPLFDTARLRQALAKALGHELPYKGLPFEEFTFQDETTVKFALEGKEFLLPLDNYSVTLAPVLSEREKKRLEPQITQKGDNDQPDLYEVLSPDGRWFVGLNDHNLWLRSTYDGRRVQLTDSGVEDYEWGDLPWVFAPVWSPDSLKLAVTRRDFREAPKIPIVHWLKPTEDVQWVPYPYKAGMPIERQELYIIDTVSKRQVQIEAGKAPYEQIWSIGWLADSSEFLFLEADRYTKKIRFAAANPRLGSTREIVSESSEAPAGRRDWSMTLVDDGKKFIWRSSRDGWHHLYLYDLDGKLIRRLTEGAFPVDRVVTVDEKAGWVYFVARPDRRRPYDTHLCRVTLDGAGFEQLTKAPGQHDARIHRNFLHRVQFSPSKQFFLDTHSSLSRPPVVELRRADGTLLRTLSKANVDALEGLHWSPPEEFVVKGADGKTDLYGTLYKPHDFDPEKKYPVIEQIHGAGATVQRTFRGRPGVASFHTWGHALAQLGFIVFSVETRSPWTRGVRGREFEKLVYGNFGRHEIPDQIAALKNLSEKRPYMDLSRVGVIGWSFTGYFAVRSMLLAPDTYHVGIAIAPVLDLYTHGNYMWLGPPESNKDAYEYASNYRLAGNLEGKLLLIQGTADMSVPISQTLRMVEALVRAEKPYDLMILPEYGHSDNERIERYLMDRSHDYFQEHLKP